MATNELTDHHALEVQDEPPLWLVKPCNTAGCSVMIRVLVTQAATVLNCKWCRSNQDYNTDPSKVRPIMVHGPLMSTDEFGSDLFEAIKTQAAIRQTELAQSLYAKKGLKRKREEATATIHALLTQLKNILSRNTIDPVDIKRLLAI